MLQMGAKGGRAGRERSPRACRPASIPQALVALQVTSRLEQVASGSFDVQLRYVNMVSRPATPQALTGEIRSDPIVLP